MWSPLTLEPAALNEQFHVGDVSVKYNGKKVAGAYMFGSTHRQQVDSEPDLCKRGASGPKRKMSAEPTFA